MEKELNRLKKQLREKDSGSEKTNQDAQTVSRLFSRGKRIAHQPKGPVLSPQQHTHVGKTEETADKDYATERFSGLRIKYVQMFSCIFFSLYYLAQELANTPGGDQ